MSTVLVIDLPSHFRKQLSSLNRHSNLFWLFTSWKALINHSKINYTFHPKESICHWQFKAFSSINFSDLNGIITSNPVIDYQLFSAWHPEDQPYIHSAYQSLWLSTIASVPMVINRCHHEMLSPSYWCLPKQYLKARTFGLKTPTFDFFEQPDDTTNLHGHHFFTTPKSDLNYCLVIHQQTFWHPNPMRKFPICERHYFLSAIKKLMQSFKLDLAEICFQLKHKTPIFLYLTPRPDWINHWKSQSQNICQTLQQIFSTTQTKTNTSLFINNKERPCLLPDPLHEG